MDPEIRMAMSRHGDVFAAADARRAGVGRTAIGARLRSGEWWRIRYGVYTTGDTWRSASSDGDGHRLECAAAVLRLGEGVTVSHASAARLHGLIVPSSADTTVRLTHPAQFRTGRGYRVTEAALPPGDVVRLGAVRATSLARTLVDCAREWGVQDGVIAMDDALADGRSTRADLTAAVLRQSHWPAIGQAARAAGLARVGAHSPHETLTRLAVGAAGLPEPVLQAAVLVGGHLVGVVDMLFDDAGVFVESDGRVKTDDPWGGRTPAEALWAEKARHDSLLDLDLRGVRVRPADLFTPWPAKAERIRALLAAGPAAGPRRFRVEQWRGGLRRAPQVPAARAACA
ncbi:type IV toxin-antitoxin system AbiEi family antitoxin domain-containing protein [Modestobacter sp. Leaf380]|uniref:type IV toxin-antitoxin system AbiEi family antitoxin domain-containing protein n=1 Tax=Modestobacter sp. Leaf380 TaxID=1736356 RepID=UPI0006FA6029|nr:type IV toxin-antitoxin system AbiEi family antitoxin domain-containing protein [Modestobacter sp. Leaf380]KQS66267.1 hypothetical protein ASG41_13180 [Modestobacter sp. Leaf380]